MAEEDDKIRAEQQAEIAKTSLRQAVAELAEAMKVSWVTWMTEQLRRTVANQAEVFLGLHPTDQQGLRAYSAGIGSGPAVEVAQAIRTGLIPSVIRGATIGDVTQALAQALRRQNELVAEQLESLGFNRGSAEGGPWEWYVSDENSHGPAMRNGAALPPVPDGHLQAVVSFAQQYRRAADQLDLAERHIQRRDALRILDGK